MAQFFADVLENFGDRPALIDEAGKVVTYAALAARATAFAAMVGDERRLVLIEAVNGVASIVAYVAALRGRHPVILTSGTAPSAIRAAFPQSDIIDADGVIRRGSGAAIELHGDLAALLSTSGSTEGARLARLSRVNLDANARSIVEYLGIVPDDRAITTLPMGYCYGLSVVNSHLAAGAALILTGRSVIDEAFWALVEHHAATSLAGVPYTYEMLETLGFRERDHATLTTLTQAGGRLPPARLAAYAAWARTRGKRFFAMYGQTEATARIAYLPHELAETNPDCIGHAIPGGALRVDETGELIYTGPNVMMGYAAVPGDLARGSELDALRTGDIGEDAGNGLFRVTGRIARFSKIAGLRISLDDLEQRLTDAGLDAVVAGDDELIAVGVIAPGRPEVAATVLRETARVPYRATVVFSVDAAPRLASGKPDYPAVLAAGRTAAAAETVRTVGKGFALVLEELMPDAKVGSGDSFISLNGDSLTYVQVSMAIEDRLGELPADWERLTVSQIDTLTIANGVTAQPAQRTMSSDILVRLAAIAAIVVVHLGVDVGPYSLLGGAVTLIMLAGFALNKFRRDLLLSPQRWSLIGLVALRYVLPYYVVLLVFQTFGNKIQIGWTHLLLINNCFPWQDGPQNVLWFIEALCQLMLATVLLFGIPAARRAAERDRWRFGIALLLGAIMLGLVLGRLWPEPWPIAEDLPRRADFYAVALALGWLVFEADTMPRRIFCAAAAYALPASYWGVTDSHSVLLALGTALILFVPRVTLWRPLATGLGFLAGTTFYIYLTHMAVFQLLLYGFEIDSKPLAFAMALATGIAAYLAWTQAIMRGRALLRGMRSRGVGAVSVAAPTT